MKTLLSFLVLLLTVSISAQKLKTSYDKFHDHTLIQSPAIDLRPLITQYAILFDSLTMQIDLGYEGQKLKGDAEYFLVVNSHSRDWEFLRSSDLVILADGKRIAFDKPERSSHVLSGGVSELLIYSLKPNDLKLLADAKTIEMQIGFFELTLQSEEPSPFKLIFAAGIPAN